MSMSTRTRNCAALASVLFALTAGCSTGGNGAAAGPGPVSASAPSSTIVSTTTTRRTAAPGPNSIVILDGRLYPRKLRVAECTRVTVTNMDSAPMRLYDSGSTSGDDVDVRIAAGGSAYFTAPNRAFLDLLLDSDVPMGTAAYSAKSRVELRIDDNVYKNCDQHGGVH